MQKTITVGNSTAITIPKDFFKKARVDENSVVMLTQQPKKKRIIVIVEAGISASAGSK